MSDRTCSVDGCDRSASTRGWCSPHYKRWLRHGDPLAGRRPDLPEIRFWSRVDKTDTCWNWTGALFAGGYGQFWMATAGQSVVAHRFAYEATRGPIPDGLQLDHRCHNRRCVNPEHLRPVTSKQNNENRRSGQPGSKSGVRGVSWDKDSQRWRVCVWHNGKKYSGGWFHDLADAAEAARVKRNELFTHNDLDRRE